MSDEPGARPVLGIEGQGRGDRTRSALVAVAAETGFGLARDASSNCHSEARRSAPTACGRTTERASVKEAIADDRAARFKHHLLVLGGDVSSRPGNALSDESRSSFGRRRSSLAVPHGGPDIRGCEVGHPRERSSGTCVSWSMKVRAVASATDNAAARGSFRRQVVAVVVGHPDWLGLFCPRASTSAHRPGSSNDECADAAAVADVVGDGHVATDGSPFHLRSERDVEQRRRDRSANGAAPRATHRRRARTRPCPG
jgi:hypothetical protein